MTVWTFIGILVLAIAAWLLLSGYLRTWLRFRGTRVVNCPENLQPAAVTVDAAKAAKWMAIAGEKELKLASCSRWPEMGGCAQECLSQIESSPDGCSVKALVTNWYAGKSCVYCEHPMETIVWHERPPALLSPRGATREWKDIRPEDLPNVFATHQPVCWRCHIVESFRRQHPEMVIERKQLPAPRPTLHPTVSVY